MNIAMFTNTYLPLLGGVSNSVQRFAAAYAARGHEVLIVAPEYERHTDQQPGVLRLPALQKFNGSDFAVVLPVHSRLKAALDKFKPQVIHSHHPFLLGETALRVAAERRVPLVYTYHTMYEYYTHYAPMDSPGLRRFVRQLSTGYANLCNRVIAPSQSVKEMLLQRGVRAPIRVIPTGVDLDALSRGDGRRIRDRLGIPGPAIVVGYVGRLAREKNLGFLARAVGNFIKRRPCAHFVMVGKGAVQAMIRRIFKRKQVAGRLHFTGALQGQALTDAYHAMDLFAFSSKSETQGMVLVEALAAGCPVVALDAPGAREVVQDRSNGRLVESERHQAFAEALDWVVQRSDRERQLLWRNAMESVKEFALDRCVEEALLYYEEVVQGEPESIALGSSDWDAALRAIGREWDLWANRASAMAEAVASAGEEESR